MPNRIIKESTYSQKLRDPRWQKKRLEILARDEWMCQNCFNSESTLMVHHRIYISGQEPWDYDDDLLITLCEDCHKGESINMPVHEKGLIEAVKLNFLSEDVQELIGGFRRMRLQHSHERVATAISWALQTPEIQRELIDRHKKYLGECYIAKTR